jgi:hypothetical protein
MEQPCMVDNSGRRVSAWLPQMQASSFLRATIKRGERTAECWEELRRRNERIRAAMKAIHGGATTDHHNGHPTIIQRSYDTGNDNE